MAFSFSELAFSFADCDEKETSFLPLPGKALLDIGASNIYEATEDALTKFLRRNSMSITPDVEKWIADYSYRSGFDAHGNRVNTAFLGELCSRLGIDYRAIDIFEGPLNLIVDLNHDQIPTDYRGFFDVVVNLGTTEHVMNQFNAFKVIHDATKVGGQMFHILPIAGHTDHGYVHYTGRFFFDLAGYNGYEILEVGCDSASESMLYDAVRSYSVTFPILRDLEQRGVRVALNEWEPDFSARDASFRIRYGKVLDKPFMGALDAATSIAPVLDQVRNRYDRNA